ncbi:MAG: DUF4384 domain-containing protein, partial [Candidatus Brocadiales bacterium]|nr:DUF4384 domain-containing protein [Candidatus Brocadiales bacterium]
MIFQSTLLSILLLIFSIPSSNVLGVEDGWVRIDTTITFSTEKSVDNARSETLAICRRAAIESVIPQTVQIFSHSGSYQYEGADGVVQDNFMLSSFVASSNMGYIVEERIKGLPQFDENAKTFQYAMNFEAIILPVLGERNPSIRLSLDTPHTVLNDGDMLNLSVRSTVEGYLYIFHIFEDNSVELLLPNQYMMNNHLFPDQAKQITDSENVVFRVTAFADQEVTTETFFGVLSVNKIPDLDDHLEVGKK